MDEFLLQIDEIKFRKTNGPWNELCLNDPWSVGYVSTLIETQIFSTKEKWEQFYYDSGQERALKIQLLKNQEQKLLNEHTLKRTNPQQIEGLETHLKNLNFQFGRTEEQLFDKGKILHNYLLQKAVDITEEECAACVRHRTICETWNGIIIRERNTVKKLNDLLPTFEFIKTNGDFDYEYAVDYEISEHGNIFCGIQIKPKTYTYNTAYIARARNTNIRKNQHYFDTFRRPVFDVISKANGEIENPDVINKIKAAKR